VIGEEVILANVRHVLTKRNRPPLNSLPSLFHAHYTHCYSLPLLDPYSAYRRSPALGPIEAMPEWKNTPEKPCLFASLAADHPSIQSIVISLAELEITVEAYIRGNNKTVIEFAHRRGLKVLLNLPKLTEVVPRASAIVSHGGSGTVHAGLLAGRPQLLIPMNAEQHVTAATLQSLGAAIVLPANAGSKSFTQRLKKTLSQGHLWAAAKRLAHHAREKFHPEEHLQALIEACNGHLAYSDERHFSKY
jgi:UDP:flavonoid glycosyltransferase YjiC (YdhE family)